MYGSRGGTGDPDPPPLKNHKNMGFLNKTALGPLKNQQAAKPAKRHLNGVSLAGR